MEATPPAPKKGAWQGNGDTEEEEQARRSQLIAERHQVGDKVSGEDRLDAIESEAGKRQAAKIRSPQNRRDGGSKIGHPKTPRRHAIGVEAGAQGLQHHRERHASGRRDERRATPSQGARHRWGPKAADQQASGNGGLLDRKNQRRRAGRRSPAQQARGSSG